MAVEQPAEIYVEHSWTAKRALLVWAVIVVTTLLGFSFIQVYLIDRLDIPMGVWAGLIFTEIGVALICLIFALYFYKGTLEELGIKRPSSKWIGLSIVLGPVLFVVAAIVLAIQTILIGENPYVAEYERLLAPTSVPVLGMWILISLVFIGPAEELFARGVVQKGFQNSLQSKILPILLSGILFGIWHLDPYRIVPISVGGIGLAYIYQKSDNNTVVVALSHGMMDSIAMILTFILS